MYQIIKKQKIGEDIYEMQIEAPHVTKYAEPGNFIILRKDEKGERIPFTIAEFNKTSVTIVFNVVGKTTADLAKLKKGNNIKDVVGPLGNPAKIDDFGSVCLVSGGTGCAASYIIAKALKKKGNRIMNIIGAKTKKHLIWEDKFKQISNTLIVCTDDGSKGLKGSVTDALEKVIRNKYFNRVITVGPPAMMQKVAKLTYQRSKTVAHLSSIMIDGIGICGGCRIKVAGETKLVCVDGPEFDAHEVDFDMLLNRNKRFRDEEKSSHHKYHGCRETKAAKRMKKLDTIKTQKSIKIRIVPKVLKKDVVQKKKEVIKKKKDVVQKKKEVIKKKKGVIKKKIIIKKETRNIKKKDAAKTILKSVKKSPAKKKDIAKTAKKPVKIKKIVKKIVAKKPVQKTIKTKKIMKKAAASKSKIKKKLKTQSP